MHAALIDGQMCLAISDENEYFETWRPYIYFSVESFASENSFVSQWPTDIHSLSFSLDPSTYFAGNKFSEVKTLSFSLRCLHLCHQKVSSKGHENRRNSHFNAKPSGHQIAGSGLTGCVCADYHSDRMFHFNAVGKGTKYLRRDHMLSDAPLPKSRTLSKLSKMSLLTQLDISGEMKSIRDRWTARTWMFLFCRCGWIIWMILWRIIYGCRLSGALNRLNQSEWQRACNMRITHSLWRTPMVAVRRIVVARLHSINYLLTLNCCFRIRPNVARLSIND